VSAATREILRRDLPLILFALLPVDCPLRSESVSGRALLPRLVAGAVERLAQSNEFGRPYSITGQEKALRGLSVRVHLLCRGLFGARALFRQWTLSRRVVLKET
jgi:hypothetical protein